MEVEALKNRPHVSMWTAEYWEAYKVLGGSRIVHQGGIGPIPLSEIAAYMDVVGVRDVDERLKFIRMIQALDGVYVTHINAQAKQKSEARRREMKAKKPRRR